MMISKRLSVFNSYETHGWLCKAFRKLNGAELQIARDFIDLNQHLSVGEFEICANRLFLDRPERPKNWTVILELLVACNSRANY